MFGIKTNTFKYYVIMKCLRAIYKIDRNKNMRSFVSHIQKVINKLKAVDEVFPVGFNKKMNEMRFLQ